MYVMKKILKWYHLPISQCFGADIVYQMCLLVKFTVP